MLNRTYYLAAVVAAALAAGPLPAQSVVAEAATTTPMAASAAAPEGRRAQIARMYELRRENRTLASNVAATADVEKQLTLQLDSLQAEAREGERYIAAIDSATAATRTERRRLEARLRMMESVAEFQDDSAYAAPRQVAAPPIANTNADSVRGTLIPSRAPADAAGESQAGPDGPRPLAVARPRGSRLPLLFYGGVTAGVVAVRAFHLDSDPGGYHDGMKTESLFPDKAVHALAAWVITSLGSDLKVGPWKSAAVVCASGVGFELAQGYVSHYDIGANCLGAAGAAAWRSWISR